MQKNNSCSHHMKTGVSSEKESRCLLRRRLLLYALHLFCWAREDKAPAREHHAQRVQIPTGGLQFVMDLPTPPPPGGSHGRMGYRIGRPSRVRRLQPAEEKGCTKTEHPRRNLPRVEQVRLCAFTRSAVAGLLYALRRRRTISSMTAVLFQTSSLRGEEVCQIYPITIAGVRHFTVDL